MPRPVPSPSPNPDPHPSLSPNHDPHTNPNPNPNPAPSPNPSLNPNPVPNPNPDNSTDLCAPLEVLQLPNFALEGAADLCEGALPFQDRTQGHSSPHTPTPRQRFPLALYDVKAEQEDR